MSKTGIKISVNYHFKLATQRCKLTLFRDLPTLFTTGIIWKVGLPCLLIDQLFMSFWKHVSDLGHFNNRWLSYICALNAWFWILLDLYDIDIEDESGWIKVNSLMDLQLRMLYSEEDDEEVGMSWLVELSTTETD